VADLERELEEAKDRWLRASADYQNLKRRAQADFEAGLVRSLRPLLEDVLLVLDYLDLALSVEAHGEDARQLVAGVELTRSKLIAALEQSDVRPIASEGTFDPARHEAIGTEQRSDLPAGRIVNTVRRGFAWRGQVLRPARVIVSAAAPQAAESKDPKREASDPSST
jgi:molecular chaperone GrpE